jgi:hypothetical protein
MAIFPSKVNFTTGDVLTATNMNDIGGAINLLDGAQYAAGKNKIINGDFGIWQRGTTSTVDGYLADRFQVGKTGDACTYSQQTFTPGAAPIAGYESQYFARQNVSFVAGAGNFVQMIQRIEDVRTFAGQTVTFSFWAKADSAKSVSIELQQIFGSGGSSAVNTFVAKQSLTTSWTRYSFTFTVPSVSGKTIGSGSYADLRIWLSAGSNFNSRTDSLGQQNIIFDSWGWQMEAGSTASPFQTATGTIQGELAACQRYYQRITAGGTYGSVSFLGSASSTTVARILFPIKQTFRATPSSIDYANLVLNDGANVPAAGTITVGVDNENVLTLNCTTTGLTQFRPYILTGNNNAAGYVAVSAEL